LSAGQTISPHQLIKQPIALYHSQTILRFVDELRTKYKHLNILLTSNKLEIVKKAVAEEGAVTLFTDAYAKRDPDIVKGEIVPLTLSNYNKDYLTYGWIYSRRNHLSVFAKEFLNQINLAR